MMRPQGNGSSAAAPARALSNPIREAVALRSEGRLQEALDVLVSPGEFSVDFYTLRGDIQLELGRINEAAGSYFAVITAGPGNLHAQYSLGVCLRLLEWWQPAAEAFEQVLGADPYRDEVRIGLGDCLLHLNRFEEALACFELCWSDGARGRATFGKAVALQLLRRIDEAETNYERLLTLDPKSEEALANLIAMSLEVVDLGRVERYSGRLLELCPKSVAALNGLALVAL